MMSAGIISLFRGQLGCFKPRVGFIRTDVGRTQIMLQSLLALPESIKRRSQAEVPLVRIRGDFEKAGKSFDGLIPLLPHQQQVPPPAKDFSIIRSDTGSPGQNSFALLELAFTLKQSRHQQRPAAVTGIIVHQCHYFDRFRIPPEALETLGYIEPCSAIRRIFNQRCFQV